MRLRRGMTLRQRQQLRQDVLARQLRLAYDRAAAYGLCPVCTEAMEQDGEPARALHGSCQGEKPGGLGCLCACNDVAGGMTVSGSLPLPAQSQ